MRIEIEQAQLEELQALAQVLNRPIDRLIEEANERWLKERKKNGGWRGLPLSLIIITMIGLGATLAQKDGLQAVPALLIAVPHRPSDLLYGH